MFLWKAKNIYLFFMMISVFDMKFEEFRVWSEPMKEVILT